MACIRRMSNSLTANIAVNMTPNHRNCVTKLQLVILQGFHWLKRTLRHHWLLLLLLSWRWVELHQF